MYFSYSRTVRARACVLSARVCVHSLIFERIISKFDGNILQLTIRGKDYVLFLVTHSVYACKRASASACVITHSLIYGRIHFKFAVNILQITTSSMGYVLFLITHCARDRTAGARASARARACAWQTHSLIFGRILFKFAGHILQMTTSYMGYTLIFTHRGLFAYLWTGSLQIWGEHTTPHK
jgi:hypothetical protein